MVTDPKTIEAIYRMSHEQKLSQREISRQLHVARKTIQRYLESPLARAVVRKPRRSKLDSFKPVIRELLDQCPRASSVVIAQRIQPLGYTGGRSILQEYVATLRRVQQLPRAYVRIESSPGDCFQIDWGHFGAIDYQGDRRKLYAFCCIECHSRRLYVEFTHSQCFETFVRCHIHAFQFMGGRARECLYDNLVTAVAEHDGRIVRFNPRFLAFARELDFYPRACNKAAGWEKGKVEKGGSVTSGKTSGLCAPSRILLMSTLRPGNGMNRLPTSVSTEKRARFLMSDSVPNVFARFRRSCRITAIPPSLSYTKISDCALTATATACTRVT